MNRHTAAIFHIGDDESLPTFKVQPVGRVSWALKTNTGCFEICFPQKNIGWDQAARLLNMFKHVFLFETRRVLIQGSGETQQGEDFFLNFGDGSLPDIQPSSKVETHILGCYVWV